MEDDPNPNISILGMEKMLYAASVSQGAVKDCVDSWMNKVPLSKKNFWKIRKTLKTLQKRLIELDSAITSFPIDTSTETTNERVKYFDSLMMITQKYLGKIKKCEHNQKEISDYENYVYFIELHSLLDGINDISASIGKTINILSSVGDEMDFYEKAKDAVMWADGYLSEGKELPDKTRFNIANLTWNYLEISHPIAKGEDGKYILQRLLIGHPKSWSMMSDKRDMLISYVKSVHKKFANSNSPNRIDGTPHNWYDFICGPRMRHLIYASDVLLTKLNRESKKTLPYYIS